MTDEHLDLHIEGMTCAACSSRIEKVLNKMPGVKAEVSLLEHRARVSGCSIDDAIAAVRRAGYDAWPAKPREHSAAHPAASGIEKFRLWFSVGALVIMLFEMMGMLSGRHITVPVSWQWGLATVMQTVIAWPFYASALRALRSGGANMETLISIGTLSAYLWSVAMMMNGMRDVESDMQLAHGALYFETSVIVLAMVRIGRHLESRARGRALRALSELMQIDQSPVLTLDESTNQWQLKFPESIAPNSLIRITPGQPISLDALITDGETEIDESSMTGESLPVAKGVGSTVYAGCLNLSEEITAKVLARFESSRRAMIGERILSALSSRAPIAALADRIASVFVPVVLVVAALTATGHVAVGAALSDAVSHAVAVLVVACPCALGLATPAAIAAGLARGAQLGWLFRSADALQRAAEVDHVVLDKTGTLTSGRPKLVAIAGSNASGMLMHTDLESVPTEQPWPDWLAAASSAERGIEHPLAGALLSYVAGKPMPRCHDVHHQPGQGVSAVIADGPFAGQTITVGKPKPQTAYPELESLHPDASAVDVLINSRWHGRLWVADSMRPDAQRAIAALNKAEINAMILSGDRESAVGRAARLLGGIKAKGAQTPEDKAAMLDQFKRDGRRVAMIGDGINDASAMAHAHLGIAMASGANITLQTADITVSSKTPLLGSVQSLMLARATIGHVKENLVFAFAFNIAAIPLAAFGLLSPTVAGSAMALSSAAVVANAARVLNWKST